MARRSRLSGHTHAAIAVPAIRAPVLAAFVALVTAATFASGSAARGQLTGSEPQRGQAARNAGDRAVQVMVLGTYHFANPGQDAVNPEVDDVMKPERQAEIRAVVESLETFRPTKIAVEWPHDGAARFDSIYRAYRSGRHQLTRNERQQLGMRLADRMGHERIYAIDAEGEFPFQEVIDYAREHEPWFIDYFAELRERSLARSDSLQREYSIGGILRRENDREGIERTLAPYMRILEVGADSNFIGVKPVAGYYERNLRIFANLTEIAEPGDRIIVIFGSGHAPFLRQFVEGHPGMELVEPNDYLEG